MSITLDLSPEIERLLRQKAALQGLELETYLGHLAERDAQAVNGKTEAASVAHVFPADFDRLVDEGRPTSASHSPARLVARSPLRGPRLMLINFDTGILLRLLDKNDPHHASIRQALRALGGRGDETVTPPQNLAEFWNVCTRPASARGEFGLSIQETDRRVRLVERLFRVLPDNSMTYPL